MASDMPEDDLAQQGAVTWAGEEGYDLAEDGQPSHHMQPSDQQASEHDYALSSAHHVPGDSTSFGGHAADDSGEYDPESVTPQIAERRASRPSPQPASKKRRTAGGFLVGDSDSEDDNATPSSSGLLAEPTIQGHSVARSPLHNSTTAQEGSGASSSMPSASQVNLAPGSLASGLAASTTVPSALSTIMSQDITVTMEARIKEDPRGAMDTWLALIAEHRRRNKLDDARSVYKRFLEVFPQSADIWIAFVEMELSLNDFVEAEGLFGKSLKNVLNVQLWTVYLDYIRRRNDLSDSTGQARLTVAQAYEFVLENVGLDKDSGRIWQDYIQFIRFAPGTIGGNGWQDQQKMDQLRKAYTRAICVPISNVNTLWKEYDQFEMGLNKMTGRKFLAERSPAYMSAKSANTAIDNLTRGLQRSNLPRLPPVPGFDGDLEYMEQVELWKKWIAWEKTDPLDLHPDESKLLQQRILYCYKQALMALRFWPELWVDAAEWCFANNITEDGKDQGMEFLLNGIEANPESILLAFKHADRIELTYPVGDGDDAKIARGKAVRAPHDKILDTLYGLIKALKDKEKAEIAKIEEAAAHANQQYAADDDEDESEGEDNETRTKAKEEKISLVKQGISAQVDLLSKSLTFVWISLARAMRRIQGKGDIKGTLGGLRQIFSDARTRGRLGSEIYVAIAKMEWKCYNDKAGGKIFDRGAKLFPEDPYFMIEYIKYQLAHNDITNSRLVFETCVNKLTQKPELMHKAKPLLAYMHKREAEYGDLARVVELEKRMTDLYPDDPKLAKFSARYSTEKFDPIAARIIISPAAQLRSKMILPSVENIPSIQNSPLPTSRQPVSPRPQLLQATNSPKRPFPIDDFEDFNPPRKIQRGDQRDFERGASPLKGAAGRRLDQQRRMHGQGPVSSAAPPAPLPTMITFLLGQMPSATSYNGDRLNAPSLVRLLQTADVDPTSWEARKGKDHRHQPARQPPSHARHISAEFPPQPPFPARNSPRPLSPYAGADRTRLPLVPASATYRQSSSSLRPASRDAYDPPAPNVYPPPQFAPPPPQQQMQGVGQFEMPPAWAQQQPPPPQMPPGFGGPPPQVYYQQQPPPGQQPPYGGYRY